MFSIAGVFAVAHLYKDNKIYVMHIVHVMRTYIDNSKQYGYNTVYNKLQCYNTV